MVLRVFGVGFSMLGHCTLREWKLSTLDPASFHGRTLAAGDHGGRTWILRGRVFDPMRAHPFPPDAL